MRAWPRANGDLEASEAVSTNDDVHCFLCIVSFSGSMPFTCEVVLVFFYHRSWTCCIFLSFCTALLKELVLLLICHRCGGGGNCFHVFLRELQTAAGAVNECSTNGWRRKCCAHLSEFHATLRQLALHNLAAILVTGTHHPRQYAQSSCGSLARTPGNESSQDVMFKHQVSKIVKSFKTSPWPASSCPQCRRLEAIQHRS